ncbi:MAG: IS4/IS5 family transposase, partial [Fusobacteria bacterium]|nr:IS4/IS5 family transposase [Fusobacteriota bacterium]
YFHSKKIASIIQEIYAKLTVYNFCEIITHSVVIEQKSKRYTYQVNFTLAIKACLTYFKLKKDAVFDLIALIAKHTGPIRPNRSFKRNGSSAVKSFTYRVAR